MPVNKGCVLQELQIHVIIVATALLRFPLSSCGDSSIYGKVKNKYSRSFKDESVVNIGCVCFCKVGNRMPNWFKLAQKKHEPKVKKVRVNGQITEVKQP